MLQMADWRKSKLRRLASRILLPWPKQLQNTQIEENWCLDGMAQEQEKSFDPKCLADGDSLFFDLNGFQIHHKICDDHEDGDQSLQLNSHSEVPEGRRPETELPMILFHGFGASVFSWCQVMKPLARLTGSKVLAFDRPAFGLTSRNLTPDDFCLNPYSTAFSVRATFSFMDLLGTTKVILIGHSAGCLVSANACLEAPERIAALILVAPAIPAPFTDNNILEKNYMEKLSAIECGSNLVDPEIHDSSVLRAILTLFMILTWPVMWFLEGIKSAVFSLYKRTLSMILRSSLAVIVVRILMTNFGVAIVKHAWYDKSKVTEQIIVGYTKPLKTRDWEMALLEYILAILIDLVPESKPSLIRRLSEITCPVLIVTGDNDQLVPVWNTKRLAAAIPGSTLEVINNCGHLPHEEKVEDFMVVVDKFLQEELGLRDYLTENPQLKREFLSR